VETETDHSHAKIEHRRQDRKAEESETSADEAEPENGMTFIRRHNVESLLALKRNANGEIVSELYYHFAVDRAELWASHILAVH
jgi:hypothetical protein